MTWQRAWSWYPPHIEIRGLAADGQTPDLQWQLDTPDVAASVSPWALLRGTVHLHHIRLRNPDLRLRPRLQTQSEDAATARALRDFYPVIRNRDPNAPAGPPVTGSPTPMLVLDDIRIEGGITLWLAQLRAALDGRLGWSLDIDTNRNTLTIAGADLDLKLRRLAIADEPPVADAGWLRGEAGLPNVALDALDGVTLLQALSVDARMDLPLASLHFLNLYHGAAQDLELSGRGRMRGRLHLTRGDLRRDTTLTVTADPLGVHLGGLRFDGDGTIELRDQPDDAGDMTIRFAAVDAFVHRADTEAPQPLFRGRDLALMIDLPEEVRPEASARAATRLILDIPPVQVPDLAALERLLPAKWGLRVHGGTGRLTGHASVSREALALDLRVTSRDADLAHGDVRFASDLDLRLRAHGHEAGGAALDLAGSHLRLDRAHVTVADDLGRGTVWNARLAITDGHFAVPLPGADASRPEDQGAGNQDAGRPPPSAADGAMLYLARRVGRDGFGALLAAADGRLDARLSVSELDWIARLLHRPFGLSLTGGGELDLDLRLADGLAAAGTSLVGRPGELTVTLLEHVATGAGRLELAVARGDARPDLDLFAAIDDGRLRRSDEAEALVDQVRFEVAARARFDADAAAVTEADLRIPRARLRDLTGLNAYLPAHSGVAFTAGTADLTADLALQPDAATGQLLLVAEGLRATAGGEAIRGDLRAEIAVHGGEPEDLAFDITGSALVLDRVRVDGAVADATDPDWHARLELKDARVDWQKPLTLAASANVTIKDARPLVPIIDNLRGTHGWIDNLNQVHDIAGHVQLSLDGSRSLVSHAMLGSQELNLGVKGVAEPAGHEGVLYARWRRLSGLLAVRGDQRRFDIFDARAKFDAYRPGEASPPIEVVAGRLDATGTLSQRSEGALMRVAMPEHKSRPTDAGGVTATAAADAVLRAQIPALAEMPTAAPGEIPAVGEAGSFTAMPRTDAHRSLRPRPSAEAHHRRHEPAIAGSLAPFAEGGP
ncbi:MAG: hypothetical protein LJE69_06015 [Thiohalocapsa sp.]|uniref:hypothetical protein n=1 Tax=Thiohalocapsa sp. TaxID=2497641 RepID=UPI0025F7EFAF|nr:hypothetical protein [Thiohalocapsa sp.]MCG6940789.1 hypothetical protein [Thiohalocapsa sp.]